MPRLVRHRKKVYRLPIVRKRLSTPFPGDLSDAVVYNLEDQIGSSVTRLNTSGAVIDKEEYYPFGDSSLRTFSSKRYRYCGKEKDSESGLYYYGARYYASWTCRFISVDPLAASYAHLTPYNYAGNKPINSIDIDGLQGENESESAGNNEPIKTIDAPPLPEVEFRVHSDDHYKEEPKKNFWQKIGGFIKNHIVDNIPVIGGLVRSVEAISKGDWLGAGIGIGEALLDATLLITTGGIGNILKAGTKSGLKFATKIIANETGENLAQSEVSEAISGATGKELPLWAQVAIGVTIGIKPGDLGKGKPLKKKNEELAGGVHPKTNVPFDKDGFPDFSGHLHPTMPNDVTINPTGNRRKDRIAAQQNANAQAGLPLDNPTPKEFVWHHHQETGRMQLVEKEMHKLTGHDGGWSIWGNPKKR